MARVNSSSQSTVWADRFWWGALGLLASSLLLLVAAATVPIEVGQDHGMMVTTSALPSLPPLTDGSQSLRPASRGEG